MLSDIPFKQLLTTLTHRPDRLHKHQCGKIAIIAGSVSMMGAAILTALAALRTGAGLVHLITTTSGAAQLNIQYPEIITHPITSKSGFLTHDKLDKICRILDTIQPDVLAIGPGLGRDPSTQDLIKPILAHYDGPKVIDADALMAVDLEFLQMLDPNTCILTPHLGEFNALFHGHIPEHRDLIHSDTDRVTTLIELTQSLNQVIVLKGFHSVIASQTSVHMNSTGNPAMATAGTGDVLTGVLAGLIGQVQGSSLGISLDMITQTGVYLHGLAGDQAAQKLGIGLIASDVIHEIPLAIQSCRTTTF